MTDNKLSLVIVNYKTPELTLRAIESAIDCGGQHISQLTVVDNSSCDGSVEIFRAAVDRKLGLVPVLLIESPKNGGFSFGNNLAIGATAANYFFLLNSDAILTSGAVDAMLQRLAANPEIGIIGPLVAGEDDFSQVSCFNNRTISNEFLRAANTGVLTRLFGWFGIKEVAQPPGGDARDVDWLSFVAVLIRAEVIADIGLMDDGYFMYLEDNDYCRRAIAKGWRVRYEPSAKVFHANKGWSGRYLEKQPGYYYRSRTRYFVKYYGRVGWLLANLAWTAGRLVSLAREVLQRKPRCVPIDAWKDIWTWSYGDKPIS